MSLFNTVFQKVLARGLWIKYAWKFRWNGMGKRWHYFEDAEVEGLDTEFVAKLDWARGRANVPFVITSGRRSPEQNAQAGGVDNSAHVKGLAVDLQVPDSHARYRMIHAFMIAGFKRIGIYDKHIHVDMDGSLPQEVIWTGKSH